MLRTILATAAAALLPAIALAAEPPRLGCDGPIGRAATRADLVKAFGAKNVRDEEVSGAEGETMTATVVNPDDPAARIEILWKEGGDKAGPETVILREESRVSIEGLAPGMTIAEVEAMNGKPFQLNGFGWDMGGMTGDWKGGRLAKLAKGCGVSVQFSPAEDAPEKALDRVSGDRRLNSADKGVRAVSPRLTSVSLGWAAP